MNMPRHMAAKLAQVPRVAARGSGEAGVMVMMEPGDADQG